MLLLLLALAAPPLANPNGPFEPAEAVKHFELAPGFRIECIAHEPAIVDPVCSCFDEKGRLYVCEMPGYPNGGRALGDETRGNVKRLEDRDGDGRFETVVTFADGLRFPTGLIADGNGVIVCNAPDIVRLRDTDGDGKCDTREVMYTGFDLTNIQTLPNSLVRDGTWIYGMVAGTGGTITCPTDPKMPAVNLRGKGFRFQASTRGSLVATSGGGQYGLTHDRLGHWFTCSNSQVCRQIVISEEQALKNPDYIPPAVTADIDVEGPSVKVFRKSPFETWRVERTTRRREGDETKRFPRTELVPGGYTSSTCGGVVYRGTRFPASEDGRYFACDPGNNLILRRSLANRGMHFQSSRPVEDAGREFLASDDNWFRPVHLTVGPDGWLYVCDFYREFIETPLSLPDDLKARMNVESRARGRIWRIRYDGPAIDRKPVEYVGTADRVWRDSIRLCETPGPQLAIELSEGDVSASFATQAAAVIGKRNRPDELKRVLDGVAAGRLDPAALTGLGQGLAAAKSSLAEVIADPPLELKSAVDQLRRRFADAANFVDEPRTQLLAFAPADVAMPALAQRLGDRDPDVQRAAVRSLAVHRDAGVSTALLAAWPPAGPALRREILEALLARPERIAALLEAIEMTSIRTSDLDPARIQHLRNHPNATVKRRATALFPVAGDRTKIVDDYAANGPATGDIDRGKALFGTHCASCHRLDGTGHDVGPNLLAAVTGKSRKELLTAILDPNREVDSRYVGHTVALVDGRVLTGIVTAETANGLTLRQADGKDETIARTNLESLRATGQSLMPEGLEAQLPKQAMADLVAYLQARR